MSFSVLTWCLLGVIHGDFHDYNIIVKPTTETSTAARHKEFFRNCTIELSGVLDFGDVDSSYLVFEIATCMAFLMGSQKSHMEGVDVCGYLLAGYSHIVRLNDHERKALKVLVAGRYVQGLVMDTYTLEINAGNEYIENSTETWEQLHEFWETPKEILFSKWDEIGSRYSN